MTIRQLKTRRVPGVLSLVKAALFAAILLTTFSTNAVAQGSISGRVTRSDQPGTGLAGTVIQFFNFNSDEEFPTETTTDATGNYTINLPASTYGILTQDTHGYINEIYNNVQCSAVCNTSLLLPVVLTNGGALTNINFVLDPGGRITGQVTNASGGAAIAGVTVYFVNSVAGPDNDRFPFTMAVTDALGNYTSNAGTVTGNVYVATSNTLGFQDEAYNNIKCPGECDDLTDIGTLVPVTLASGAIGINFALDIGGGITGTVKDAGNNPLANVRVRIFDATGDGIGGVLTNGAGVYTAGGLATGNYYAITQNALGFLDQLYNGITCTGGECNPLGPPAGTPIAVTAGATTNINFTLALGGTISGTVKNTSNIPLANVNVHIYDATGNFVTDTFTNGAGVYAAGGLATGNYYAKTNEAPGVVDVVYPNGLCAGGSCNVTTAGGTLIAVTVGVTTPNINFVLSPGGTVTGTVTKAAGGAPVEAFVGFNMVNAAGQNIFVGGTNPDDTGHYSVVLPPGANYALVNNAPEGLANQLYNNVPCATALATGFTTCNPSAVGTPINVVAGATLNNINFALQPGGIVSGNVLVGGVPTGSIQVQIFTLSGTQVGQVQSLATDPIGVYTFTNLPPGQYYLRTNTGGAPINQMTGGVVCVQCNVTTTGGTPITITAGANTSNTNFALVNGGRITGTITHANTAAPLGTIPVQFFNAAGVGMGQFNSNATTGVYFSSGLPAGTYYVKTAAPVLRNVINEAYNNVPCMPCNVLASTAVTIVGTANTTNINFALAPRVPGDVTGDGKADVGVFRPASGTWYVRDSTTAGLSAFSWGQAGDTAAAGDYDGDGKADVAIFRAASGTWYVRNSTTGGLSAFAWGQVGDTAVTGDYDGDGKADVAIFRAASGTWYVRNSSTAGLSAFSWGQAGDTAVAGDYDGDGKADVAIFRAASGTWYVRNSSTGGLSAFSWGQAGDTAVPGDYDGDGKADVAVFRAASGTWYVRNSSTGALSAFTWGQAGDTAVAGDYDGDGKTDVAIFRAATGTWYVRNSSTGALSAFSWGQAGDIPILQRP